MPQLSPIEVASTLTQIIIDMVRAKLGQERRIVIVIDPDSLTSDGIEAVNNVLPHATYYRRLERAE